MIFSDSPSQKALERMMTQVKGFPPRGSGVMVLRRFEYTAEMCECRLCLYYNRKKKCTVSQCPCIEERIVAGAADRSEAMAETMKNIHNAAFHRRLNQFINESEELHMNFRNEKHRLAFVEAIRKLDKKNFALMSALYLQITLSDEDGDDVRVKLYSESEVGKHLLLTLNDRNSLADANMLAFMVDNAKPDFRTRLEQNLVHDQYGSMQEVTDAIKQMLYDSGPVKAVFYCPLVGEVTYPHG